MVDSGAWRGIGWPGQVTGVAKVKLPVIAKGKKRRQEVRTGKVKIKAKVTYNAVGNAANTLKRKLKLLKR